jgi:DNA repair exonuclease SbcCD nuclease subunit
MKFLFWTDPHLGLSRSAHTTAASRERLRSAINQQVRDIVELDGIKVCAGDLFDTCFNNEATIVEGYNAAINCERVLAGNHDLANREGAVPSMRLLEEMEIESIVLGDPNTTDYSYDFYIVGLDRCVHLYMVPHKSSQQLFDATLAEVVEHAQRESPMAGTSVLCLHCNYDSGFATQDSTLNLTREQAKQLLEKFDYVLLGHEHVPRSDFGGRLQILGNIHPTSFSDISDKYIWFLEDGKLRSELIWNSNQRAICDWAWLLDPHIESGGTKYPTTPRWDGIQFIDVVGEAPAEQMPAISRAIQKLWQDVPSALMIRNNVKSEALQIEQRELAQAMSVPDRVTHELEGSDFSPLWRTYLERLETQK